jgi:hypothetical protein
MNAPKCQPEDDINFLVASPRGERHGSRPRTTPSPASCTDWSPIRRRCGRRPRPWSRATAGYTCRTTAPWTSRMPGRSGGAHGIGRASTGAWCRASGSWRCSGPTARRCFPCDDRRYAKDTDGLTKHDLFRAMPDTAKARGFAPAYAVRNEAGALLQHSCTTRQHHGESLITPPPGGGRRGRRCCRRRRRGSCR